jgi:hypothetical protein
VQAVDTYPALEPLLELQLAYCEAAEGNPQWATALAHRFEAEVRRLGRDGQAFERGAGDAVSYRLPASAEVFKLCRCGLPGRIDAVPAIALAVWRGPRESLRPAL